MSGARAAAVAASLGLVVACAASCGRAAGTHAEAGEGAGRGDKPSLAKDGGATLGPEPPDAAPSDPREVEAWARAKGGDEDELGRLAEALGCTGLRERAAVPALRATALRAMGSCGDFSELAWMAEVAAGGSDADSAIAFESIIDLVARPRRALDPDDADEVAEGCRTLLAVARAADGPRARRVGAIRALRMLSERGCTEANALPSDLDAK
ncbi:MAG: hypothetical protein FWD17_18575 [Polyangiaceae bacterium]|nr:hypothetical protein [Polyangiaceae bacterium]